MNRLNLVMSIAASAFAASMAIAGPGGPGYGPGPGCMDSAGQAGGCGYGPGAGMGPGGGMGPGYGMGGGGHGMSLLTPEERTAHMTAMHSLKTVDECNAYVTEHHRLMVERAAAQGITPPAGQGNMCERMKARGLIS